MPYYLSYDPVTGKHGKGDFHPHPDSALDPLEREQGLKVLISSEPLLKFGTMILEGHGEVQVRLPDMEAIRRTVSAQVDLRAAQAVGPQWPDYPAKEAEARSILAGNAVATPILDAQITITGETLEDAAKAVIAAAEQAMLRLHSIGARRTATKQLIAREENIAKLAELGEVSFND